MALALGEWDVDGMARQMPMGLRFEWEAYFRDQPLPEKRADWRAAQIAATMRNTMVALWTKKERSLPVSDFLLKFERPKPAAPAATYAMIKSYFMLGPGLVDKRANSGEAN